MKNNYGIGGGLNREGGLLEGGGGLIEDLRYLKRGTGSGEWGTERREQRTANTRGTGK